MFRIIEVHAALCVVLPLVQHRWLLPQPQAQRRRFWITMQLGLTSEPEPHIRKLLVKFGQLLVGGSPNLQPQSRSVLST